MHQWIDLLVVGIALSNLAMLGSSRLNFYIRAIAFQGIILGFLPLLALGHITIRLLLLALGTFAIKGIVFPRLLSRIVRDVYVQREVSPYVGYGMSLFAGLVSLLLSFWLASRLPLPERVSSTLVVPVSFFTILVGLQLIVTRRQAVTQVLGYIVLENGIYTFGAALVPDTPLLVELGVLLDVFVAVFVMGITIFHMSREFEHVDTEQMATLKD